jgi:hypothetical protein
MVWLRLLPACPDVDTGRGRQGVFRSETTLIYRRGGFECVQGLLGGQMNDVRNAAYLHILPRHLWFQALQAFKEGVVHRGTVCGNSTNRPYQAPMLKNVVYNSTHIFPVWEPCNRQKARTLL